MLQLQLLLLPVVMRTGEVGRPHAPPLPADGSIVDLFRASGPGGGTEKNISSMWGPSLIVAGNNTVIAFGECDRSPSSHDPWMGLVRSLDGGSTWQPRQTLYGCGSPAALYSAASETIFVFFGECAGASQPPGPPYGLTSMSCAGGSVHWGYNATTQHLRSAVIQPPESPLGVKICEGGVKPIAGDGLGVGMSPDQPESCPAADLRWKIEGPPTYFVRHVDTGLCLTIPPRKSAVLQPCGLSKGEGQKFIWEGGTLKLAKGMFRAGECLGFIKKSTAVVGAAADAAPSSLLGSSVVAAETAKPSKLCTVTQVLYCNSSRFRQVLEGYPKCKACLGAHAAQLKSAKCSDEQMKNFCGHPVGACGRGPHRLIALPAPRQLNCKGSFACVCVVGGSRAGPAPRVGPNGERSPPTGSNVVVMRSTDTGRSWSSPVPILVTNTWGPHYAGNDLAHGIELVQDGPHKGRLAIARRYDGTKSVAAAFSRSFVLFSDNGGNILTYM